MQAEHRRGNGFIVSPLSVPFTVDRPKKKLKPIKVKRNLYIGEYIKDIFSQIFGEWKQVRNNALKTVVSVSAVAGCAIFFCNFFTVGTAIYKGNKLIAFSTSQEAYSSALTNAISYACAENEGTDDLCFRTAPALTLRSNISYNNILCDKLLESSPAFSYGCTLYSGDTPIFSTHNESIAKEVVNEYISSYSMNGEANTEVKLTYRNAVIPNKDIYDREKCLSLLTESGSVPVVSVVSTSQEKEIPFETQTQYDAGLYIGESITVTEGQAGSTLVESQTIYKNGAFESSRVLSENVVVKPVAQVVRVGTKPKDVLNSGLFYPLTGTLSSPFGERWGRMHEGIDIAVPVGTSVKAAECGTVIFAGNGGTYGNLVKIDHGNGVVTAYAHLDKIKVSKGQAVNSNTEIALSGNTGRSTGPHLHFEVVKDGVPLNPNTYLKKR